MADAQGVGPALDTARGLQSKLLQRLGELKRPVMAKSRTAAQIQNEESALKLLQDKLGSLEKKLKVFQSIDVGKGDEKAAVMTKMDSARRDLLAAAREAEQFTFVGKDVVANILDFCQLKRAAEPEIVTPRHFAIADVKAVKTSTRPQMVSVTRNNNNSGGGAQGDRRDDQPQPQADQPERARRIMTTPTAFTPAPATPVSAGAGSLRSADPDAPLTGAKPGGARAAGAKPAASPTQARSSPGSAVPLQGSPDAGPRPTDSPQVTQDSSLCNMDSGLGGAAGGDGRETGQSLDCTASSGDHPLMALARGSSGGGAPPVPAPAPAPAPAPPMSKVMALIAKNNDAAAASNIPVRPRLVDAAPAQPAPAAALPPAAAGAAAKKGVAVPAALRLAVPQASVASSAAPSPAAAVGTKHALPSPAVVPSPKVIGGRAVGGGGANANAVSGGSRTSLRARVNAATPTSSIVGSVTAKAMPPPAAVPAAATRGGSGAFQVDVDDVCSDSDESQPVVPPPKAVGARGGPGIIALPRPEPSVTTQEATLSPALSPAAAAPAEVCASTAGFTAMAAAGRAAQQPAAPVVPKLQPPAERRGDMRSARRTAPAAALPALAQLGLVAAPPARQHRRSAPDRATYADPAYDDDALSAVSWDGSDCPARSGGTAATDYVRSRRRGFWGGALRVAGIITTVTSVAVATGAAVFAAAALNSGLNELDQRAPGLAKQAAHKQRKARRAAPAPPYFPAAHHPDMSVLRG